MSEESSDAFDRGSTLKGVDCVDNRFGNRGALDLDGELARLKASDLQQVIDHRLELFDIPQNDFQVPLLFRLQFAGQSVQENGHELIDRSQRRTKLVRYVREELVLELHLMCADELGFFLQAVTLDGIAKSSGKRAIFDLSFDQIVLRACLHGVRGHCLIVQTREHDYRDIRGHRVRLLHGFEAMCVRQSHVQQDDVHPTFREVNQGFTHAQDVSEFEAAGASPY